MSVPLLRLTLTGGRKHVVIGKRDNVSISRTPLNLDAYDRLPRSVADVRF
jgi:hypothetical protein